MNSCIFYDADSKMIKCFDTPETLGMEQDDQLEVYQVQNGGNGNSVVGKGKPGKPTG